jgi:transposase, IS5 family
VTDKFTTLGFADYFMEQRRHSNEFLDKIDQFVNWKSIEKLLKKKYKKTMSADGRPAYPPLPMFKLLLLQRWYGLSDPGLEEALNDRISFIRFSGFSLSSPLPDYSTICRFRNTLLDENIYESLFAEVNRQLEEKDLLVKGAHGAIVDATIIESSRRPRKLMEIIPEDRKEEETKPSTAISYSDDTDATWIKKGKRPYYGYKAHVSVDAKDGYVIGGHVTPANVADTTELEKLVDDLNLPEGSMIFADKGYASENNRTILARKKLQSGIMDKAVRNKPLTLIQIMINKLISSIRYKVERSIGTLKRGYRFTRMRYTGLKKGKMELLLNAIAFNLKKVAAMVE